MRIIDISWPLGGETTYKNDPKKKTKIVKTRTLERDGSEESLITLSSHSGTHVDAPRQFLANGETVDRIMPGKLVGIARVFSIRAGVITEKELAGLGIK